MKRGALRFGLQASGFGLLLMAAACGGGGQPVQAPSSPAASASGGPASAAPGTALGPGALSPMLHFHSKRFNLHLPLPDGRAWRIDDHSQPELVATHAPTKSKVVILVEPEAELMNRETCEARARARKLVPEGELHTLENHTLTALEQFDTRLWVAIEPPNGPGKPIVGHVLAFGGFLRKCFFFHYSTEVASDKEEDALAERLALARTRIFDGIDLDPFAAAPREERE